MRTTVTAPLALLALLSLAACTGPSPAPDGAPNPDTTVVADASVVPGACLEAYLRRDADRATLVECTEEHIFDVFGTAEWPGMADALAEVDPGELLDQIADPYSTPLSEAYWDWAHPTCNSVMRKAIGLTGTLDGLSMDELNMVPAGLWARDASLPAPDAFAAGDHSTLCSVTWTDVNNEARTVAYPAGMTGLDLLAATFPVDQRICFTEEPETGAHLTTACDEPHSGQYLLVFDGLPALGADYLATMVIGVGLSDYAVLDEYCTVALDTVFPGVLDSPDWIVWSDGWGTEGWEDYDGTIDPDNSYPMYCGVLAAGEDNGARITGDVLSGNATP